MRDAVAKWYRLKAGECLAEAEKAPVEELRDAWRELADKWLQLAAEIDHHPNDS